MLAWFNFCLDFRLYGPIIIVYFAHVSGSYTLGGAVFAVTNVVSAVCDVPAGVYSDRVGRKKTIVLGAIFSTLAIVLYALGGGFGVLALGAVAEGLSRALYSGNNEALLYGLLAEQSLTEQYHTYAGKLSAMFQAALSISGLLGSFVVAYSLALTLWLSVVPQIVSLFLALRLTGGDGATPRSKHDDKDRDAVSPPHPSGEGVDSPPFAFGSHLLASLRAFIDNPRLRLLVLGNILGYGLGEASYQFQAAFYATLVPLPVASAAKVLSNVGATASFYFSGRVINKLKAVMALLLGDVYGAGASLVALLIPTAVSPFLMASTSLWFGIGTTATASLMQQEFTDDQRATMSSLSSFAGSLFFALAVLVVGALADHLGVEKALLLVQVALLPVIWFHFRLYRQRH